MRAPDEANSPTIGELIAQVERDEFRESKGFSPDLTDVNAKLFATSDAAVAREEILKWLGRCQPCLFGKIAARQGALSTCILFDADLRSKSDEWISDQIQSARFEWMRDGFKGSKSGFVIALISESLANAQPDTNLFRLAQRLCELYLLRSDIEIDRIYHDELFLEASNRERTAWKWLAGVNFFGSCGDLRWWQDHRIPGGIALSVNSVGHLVKSRILAEAEQKYGAAIDSPTSVEDSGKMDSLETALVWAMRTIHGATDTPCGKATYLLPKSDSSGKPPCVLPTFLADFEHRFYEGYYHTDFTLPSTYFRPDVARPDIVPTQLDFTYLTERGIGNPDHILMGRGRRIREPHDADRDNKRALAEPVIVSIDESLQLVKALEMQ